MAAQTNAQALGSKYVQSTEDVNWLLLKSVRPVQHTGSNEDMQFKEAMLH